MEQEKFISGYCRQLDASRMVEVVAEDGDIHFFQAGDRHVGFTRGYEGKTYRVYCNRDADPWEIPSGKLIAGFSLQIVAPDWLTLGPRGYCITEDE